MLIVSPRVMRHLTQTPPLLLLLTQILTVTSVRLNTHTRPTAPLPLLNFADLMGEYDSAQCISPSYLLHMYVLYILVRT